MTMLETSRAKLDDFFRRHPAALLALTLLAALATTAVLLVFSQGQKILYKAF